MLYISVAYNWKLILQRKPDTVHVRDKGSHRSSVKQFLAVIELQQSIHETNTWFCSDKEYKYIIMK